MAQQAIRIEGRDEFTQAPVRIELTVITGSLPQQVTTPSAAPQGFMPEEVRARYCRSGCGAAGQRSDVLAALADGFRAPRGFLPA